MKKCSRCSLTKKIIDFAPNGWCKQCMSEYRKEQRRMHKGYIRIEFSRSILSDRDMEKEMRAIPCINPKGVNALIDFQNRFEKLTREIKSFNAEPKKRRNYNDQRYRHFRNTNSHLLKNNLHQL